ncbi:hypothetical protein NO263_14170 [Gluconacetobacter entanii]|uniref:Uncharacterized protein n=1 Tax=Gluconacetobacter entanii TaxID=108528 RepID=A0ABT3K8L8_9PROT|nr:hypothetical protein [Gluconacetobacter entanii]MBE7620318.1 hypothetical protein [Komagataeibacter sp. FXV2]MCW4591728.1 hypothetical protein [Gluconacetobacter entanii]MCW4593577.1 hypothetical protein [Gluconacetobacter entanii]NPC88038.1 hypothetical protein [Gluconacetobacter entanii]
MTFRTYLLAAALSVALPVLPAMAQQAPAGQQQQPTDEQKAMMMHDITAAAQYRLPNNFFTVMIPTIREIKARNVTPPESGNLSLSQTIERTAQMDRLMPILREHGLSASDFVMGITTFGMTTALMHQQAPKGAPALNPANIKLINAHPQETETLIQEMGGQLSQP